MKKLTSIAEVRNYPHIKTWLIAENIRSAYNIGAMFRTADGTGMTGIILTGYSPTPENPKVAKTALGAERVVPWFEAKSTTQVIEGLEQEGITIYGLEIVKKAENIFNVEISDLAVAICVGNEVEGVSLETLQKLKQFLFVPMNGAKNSLNVAEAASVAMYELYRKRELVK